MNRTLQEEVEASLADGYLPCAVALKIARKFEVAPKEVGDVANKLGIRIINCQLGCFKFEKADPDDLDSIPVSSALAAELKSSLVAGKLPCGVAFDVARKVKVSPKQIGDATNKLNMKIVGCQLGCFP